MEYYHYKPETATPAELAKAERNGLWMTAHRIKVKMARDNQPIHRSECSQAEWDLLTKNGTQYRQHPPPIITT